MDFDHRLTPARPDLAALRLQGRVAAERYAAGVARRVTAGLLDLTLTPAAGGELATQLLHGEVFTVYETRADGLAWGQSEADGYVGYVAAAGLGPNRAPGRRLTALCGHRYAAASLKARVTGDLPFLADLDVTGDSRGFAALRGGGHVPLPHFAEAPGDFAAQAARFLGAPYLWGGRSARGLDCSALVQLALMAAGWPAPRDTDMQATLLGAALDGAAAAQRGDLVFWKGHVGVMLDAGALLHANAHHMAVTAEPLAAAAARIEAAAGGAVTARRRIAFSAG